MAKYPTDGERWREKMRRREREERERKRQRGGGHLAINSSSCPSGSVEPSACVLLSPSGAGRVQTTFSPALLF